MDDKGWREHIRPVRAAGAAEAIARRLSELIGARMLVAGDRFPSEKALAELFEVAPMTIRHSMAVLREEGLVETRRGHLAGTYVAPEVLDRVRELTAKHTYTEAEVEELTVWREAVSGEASARAAARLTTDSTGTEAADADSDAADAVTGLRDRLRELETRTNAELGDPGAYRTADAALHLFIAELSGSRRLLEAEQGIQHELTRLLAADPGGTESRSTPAQLHGPLVRAILADDPAAAREEFRIHARATADMCLILSRPLDTTA